MKLVQGEDLRAVFDRIVDPNHSGWTTTRALDSMLRVCEAMADAHAKGVIHRELKPGSVMVGKYGEAYVMDRGLAKVLGQEDRHDPCLRTDVTSRLHTDRNDAAQATPDSPLLTMDGAIVGTPAYMPPEQATGRVEEIGPPADVKQLVRCSTTCCPAGFRTPAPAIGLAHDSHKIRNTLAWALAANGWYHEAIAESEKALELAPADEKDDYRDKLERLREMIGPGIAPNSSSTDGSDSPDTPR